MPNTSNPLRAVLNELHVRQIHACQMHTSQPSTATPKPTKNEAWRSKADGNTYWTHQGKYYTRTADGTKKEIGQQEYEKAMVSDGRTGQGRLGKKDPNHPSTQARKRRVQ